MYMSMYYRRVNVMCEISVDLCNYMHDVLQYVCATLSTKYEGNQLFYHCMYYSQSQSVR